MTGVVARLTGANVLGAASGFITGPLLARALGASGRGDLAAVILPFTVAAPVFGLGISVYAYRALPRGRPIGAVIGSLGLPLLLLGGVAAGASVPLADALAGGRETVRAFLIVGFLAMPLVIVGNLLITCLASLERWRALFVTKVTPFAVALLATVALYLDGRLTVATAATAAIAGSLLAAVPALPLLRAGRLVFQGSLARTGLSFGMKSWIGGLAQMANARLDQLLMITLVAPRVLGLYAVATTISGASSLAAGALGPPLMARTAAGEVHLMAQAVRIMLAATVALNVILALITPLLLSVLFGPQFVDAYPMALILLAAQVPLSAAEVLSTALQGHGAPLIPTIGEGIALVITVAGLAVLLGPLGGEGAAIVSLAAYAASFLFQLVMARRRTRITLTEFLVPTRADVNWARGRIVDLSAALRGRE